MAQNRYYSSAAPPTTLAAAITSGASTTISVNSITGLPGSYPFTMLIDWGLSTQEAVSVTGAPTGTGPYTLTVTRGVDGTTAQTHINGAVIVHGVTAQDYNEPQVHIAASSGVHGVTGSVVGTTDTQTLTNKTFGASSYTGAITVSASSATGDLVNVTNTHASPSNPNVQWTAAGVADSVLGIEVTGDTNQRFQVNSAGKVQWGPGGATAVDTDLYRSSAGTLTTDGALVVGTSVTGATEALSSGQSGGAVLSVTNTVGAPTAPNVISYANSATDKSIGVRVTGDTQSRLHILANGHIDWGPGGSTAVDTNLYRNAAGEAKTDNSLTVASNLTVGGAQLLAGGSGVLGINNAGTNPTTTPSGGCVVHAKSGHLRSRGTDGLDFQAGPYVAYLTSAFTNTTTGSYQTITGMTAAIIAGTYMFRVWALFSQAATVGTVAFAVNGPTTSTLAYSVEQLLGTTLTEANATAYNSGPTSGTLTAATTYLVKIQGLLVATGSGTLAATVNQSAAGTLSVLAGSFLEVHAVV